MKTRDAVGVVVIGRNEGKRLQRCLRSLVGDVQKIVYVDSGSTDDSVDFAESLGVRVVELDMSKPFTMARGRNTGFAELSRLHPEVEYVQFVDGDCEVAGGWIEAAVCCFSDHPDVVAVCGRRRELFPNASIYNRLCDLEWEKPPGETKSSGGDVMMMVDSLRQCGGYNETMIAGEEGDLCHRLRSKGGRILRLDVEMTRHDAAITRWSQWVRRAVRGGHAYAEGAHLHGRSPERYNVQPTRSALFWGLLVPIGLVISVVLGAQFRPRWFLLTGILVCGYVLLLLRVYHHSRNVGRPPHLALLQAFNCVLAKGPEALGIVRFYFNRLIGARSTLIEYK